MVIVYNSTVAVHVSCQEGKREMAYVFDLSPRPRLPQRPWTRIQDYRVTGYYPPHSQLIAPKIRGFKHAEASSQFDGRMEKDGRYGINRAEKYVRKAGSNE